MNVREGFFKMQSETILLTVIDNINEIEHIVALNDERELAHFLLHYDKDKFEIIDIEKKYGSISTNMKEFFIKQPDNFEHGGE